MDKPVLQTHIWPHSAHGHLFWLDGGAPVRSSGVLVGPRHVLTAAHNVDGADLSTMRFNPAQSGGKFPGGKHQVQDFALPKPWRENRDPYWDLAVLLLKTQPSSGYYAIAAAPPEALNKVEVALNGYPFIAGVQMWHHTGRIIKDAPDMLYYSMNTRKGESGGALYVPGPNGRPTIVGIHRYRDATGCEGVRITPDKLMFIHKHFV